MTFTVDQVPLLVTRRIESLTADLPDGYSEILRHLLNNEAKMLRPTLTFLAGNAISYSSVPEPADESELMVYSPDNYLVDAATAIELTHISSLYHDDIIDQDDFRRGVESANKKFGVGKALIAGDYLFAMALELTEHIGNRATQTLIKAFRKMCYGQIYEITREIETMDQYYELIDHKTVALIEGAVELGLIAVSPLPAESEFFSKWLNFAQNFGRAFQIADDRRDNPELLQKVGVNDSQLQNYLDRAQSAASKLSNPRTEVELQHLIDKISK
ncbi:MAG: polyprenyl synthetase family protein [Bifidobacteriaceae bacterium]|jgi:geranylgeranyl pyrophosphate synthase|nr:polyprenyl synthetase family protein [Bifidobacteriaceae bacterium]